MFPIRISLLYYNTTFSLSTCYTWAISECFREGAYI